MTRPKKAKRTPPSIAGWREWVAFPALGIPLVKAKLDTGARTSALHAFDITIEEEGGIEVVRFKIHPRQRSREPEITASAPLKSRKWVRSSNGQRALRPVIATKLQIGDRSWTIDLTLTNRGEMGFRVLLGRHALRRRLLVDSSKSFLSPEPPEDGAA